MYKHDVKKDNSSFNCFLYMTSVIISRRSWRCVNNVTSHPLCLCVSTALRADMAEDLITSCKASSKEIEDKFCQKLEQHSKEHTVCTAMSSIKQRTKGRPRAWVQPHGIDRMDPTTCMGPRMNVNETPKTNTMRQLHRTVQSLSGDSTLQLLYNYTESPPPPHTHTP